jgi:signal transduction histidine kinase
VLEGGLDAALQRYCQAVSNDKLQVAYFSIGNISRFAANFELSLYRITQELINNIIKHADAAEAMVQISQQDNLLSLTIEDDGKGFHQCRHATGTGINSVCKRVEAMNGHMEVTSAPGRGTSIYLEFET